MSGIPKPQPPWRIRIEGSDADLKDLVHCLIQGPTRIFEEHGKYFLESEFLNEIQDPAVIPSKTRELLNAISGVARVRRSMANPIKFAHLWWKDSSGAWRQTVSFAVAFSVYSNVTRLTASGLFERCVDLALKDDQVRSNLDDLLGQWDFPRLRRIGETLLLDLGDGDVLKGMREVVKRGWASQANCHRFWKTVNFGDTRSLGAHSPLRGDPGDNPMNLITAGEFLSDVIAKWLESKV